MIDYTDEQNDAVTEYFDTLIESQTEYEESHVDADYLICSGVPA